MGCKHEYIMCNANAIAPTLTRAIFVAVLSLVLSLRSVLKAVAIISNLQSLKSAREWKSDRAKVRDKVGIRTGWVETDRYGERSGQRESVF